eukprot:1137521-Pelagomonas_calceolata.AAC.1
MHVNGTRKLLTVRCQVRTAHNELACVSHPHTQPGCTTAELLCCVQAQGYDIGGRPIYLPHFPIHRDPDYWGPDAAEFKPERWLDEAYLAKLHPCCYMPFSKGARDCIGQTFAIMVRAYKGGVIVGGTIQIFLSEWMLFRNQGATERRGIRTYMACMEHVLRAHSSICMYKQAHRECCTQHDAPPLFPYTIICPPWSLGAIDSCKRLRQSGPLHLENIAVLVDSYMQEVKTLLAMLYSNYTFKYACAEPEGQAYRITSYPKNRVPVTVHSRSRQK